MISLTKNAITQLKYLITKNNCKAIFFGAKGGGCNGFEYVLKPTNNVNNENMSELVSISGLPFILCNNSQFLFIGTEIDWKEDFMGQRFEFNNPSSTGTCGCNTSFSVD